VCQSNSGIITGVTILTPPKPKSKNVALLALDSYEKVREAFTIAKRECGEILSAFEFWDADSLELVLKHTPSKDPFDASHPFYILIETSGSNQEHDTEKVGTLLENLVESEVVNDGILATSGDQIKNFWEIRESIPVACAKDGGMFKYDISLPLSHLYSLVTEMQAHLSSLEKYQSDKKHHARYVVGFGHVGDCNLHLNIMTTGLSPEMQEAIEPFIYERTKFYKGSISAEHGLGVMKAPYLNYSQDETSIEMMRRVKDIFDPKGILNPYKYFPEE
jgi:(R)-2-hydroxyglutarate---pyruvate transhydrogenase